MSCAAFFLIYFNFDSMTLFFWNDNLFYSKQDFHTRICKISVPSYRVHYTYYEFAQIPLNYLNVISRNPFKMSFLFQILLAGATIGTINLGAILQTSLHNYKKN